MQPNQKCVKFSARVTFITFYISCPVHVYVFTLMFLVYTGGLFFSLSLFLYVRCVLGVSGICNANIYTAHCSVSAQEKGKNLFGVAFMLNLYS